jgi:hypothetical protein
VVHVHIMLKEEKELRWLGRLRRFFGVYRNNTALYDEVVATLDEAQEMAEVTRRETAVAEGCRRWAEARLGVDTTTASRFGRSLVRALADEEERPHREAAEDRWLAEHGLDRVLRRPSK